MTRPWTRCLALAALAVTALTRAAAAQLNVYASRPDGIYRVNTATGALITPAVVTLTGAHARAALAQRASDGMIFFISGTSGNDTTFRWDPSTPASPPVMLGRTGAGIPYLPRMAFSAGGTLYAVDVNTARLYTVNQTTGVATTTGAALSGGPAGQVGGDIAIAPSGTMYSVLNNVLYVVPLAGGALTNRGTITGMTSAATGMAFDARGRLLVAANGGNTMYLVNNWAAGSPTATNMGATGLTVQDLGSVLAADLRVTKSHAGSFAQGQLGATYTVTVRDSGNLATSAAVTMTDTLPAGLAPASAAGTGWTCPAPSGQVVTCTRADALASGGAYPAITVTVNVAASAPLAVTNTARVAGGGEPAGNPALAGNNSAADATTITAVVVVVAPDGRDTVNLLPSNGTGYRVRLGLTNAGAGTQNHDLFAFAGAGASWITVDSIRGPTISFGALPDSARATGPAAGATDSVDVWFQVGNVAAGSFGPLYLAGRVVAGPSVRDSGWAFVRVVRPSIQTVKTVNPSGTLAPGTDLTYTITVTNAGTEAAVSVVSVDSLAPQVHFAVGSVASTLPPGVSVAVTYSNTGGATWAYTPVSAGCGAPPGFDDCVTHIRWSFLNPLGQTAPNNTAALTFSARIR
jgi:uncharacterized repeat protein (TIGR01451 family)